MSTIRQIFALLVLAGPAVSQTPADPFLEPIAGRGEIRVNFTEFATIPEIGGSPDDSVR